MPPYASGGRGRVDRFGYPGEYIADVKLANFPGQQGDIITANRADIKNTRIESAFEMFKKYWKRVAGNSHVARLIT